MSKLNWERVGWENLIEKVGSENINEQKSKEEFLKISCKFCNAQLKNSSEKTENHHLETCLEYRKLPAWRKDVKPIRSDTKVELHGLLVWVQDDSSVFSIDAEAFMNLVSKKIKEINQASNREFDIKKINGVAKIEDAIFPKTNMQGKINNLQRAIKTELGISDSEQNFSNEVILTILKQAVNCYRKAKLNMERPEIIKKSGVNSQMLTTKASLQNKTNSNTHFLLVLNQYPQKALNKVLKLGSFVGKIKAVLEEGNKIKVVDRFGSERIYLVSIFRNE